MCNKCDIELRVVKVEGDIITLVCPKCKEKIKIKIDEVK